MENMPVRLDDLIDFVHRQQPEGDPLDHLSDAVLTAENLGTVGRVAAFVAARTGAGP